MKDIDAVSARQANKAHAPNRVGLTGPVELSAPSANDAAAVHELIARCKPLDLNSTYAYLLLCYHFSDTCVIARVDKKVVGFISGYVLPNDLQTFFVWQVAVHPDARGAQLGVRMLVHLLRRKRVSGTVRFMETTVSPSNTASRRMFQRVANEISAPIEQQMLFDRSAFGNEEHEEEVLLKIGPFVAARLREVTQ